MVSLDEYNSGVDPSWCPGCGNFSILDAMKDAFSRMNLAPEKLLIVSGIGQAGKTPHFLNCNFFHGLHGRALPVATGAKIANHELNIVVSSGDGDCYGEGGNHFISAVRRNIDITLLVHNNKVYGLTKGQFSATADEGLELKGQGCNPYMPVDIAWEALVANASFVARSFAGDPKQVKEIIKAALINNKVSDMGSGK